MPPRAPHHLQCLDVGSETWRDSLQQRENYIRSDLLGGPADAVVAVDGDKNNEESRGADEGVCYNVIDVGEVEHLDNLVLPHPKGSEDKDLDKIETDREKITQVREREGSEIEKGDIVEARSTDEENIGEASKDAEEDEDGADDPVGHALDQPLVVEAGRFKEGL